MQTINVRTTQNVLIAYPIAGVFDRILALILDWLVFIAYILLGIMLLAWLKALDSWSAILIYLPVFFYNLIFEIAMDGQTPGKRMMHIKVVRVDGESPTIANYILRWILWPVDVLMGGSIAITFILLTNHGQRLGDLAAGTTVIKLTNTGVPTGQKIIQSLKEDYQPSFPEVVDLTDSDISLIKEALDVNLQFGNVRPAELIAKKIKDLCGIQTDLPAVGFLYTVLKDYHHLTSVL